ATVVVAATFAPRYTPNNVSKVLPTVRNVAIPLAVAVQVYQTELLPGLPACNGSPTSRVVKLLVPVAEPLAPESGLAAAKLSFAGGEVTVTMSKAGVLINVPPGLAMTTVYVAPSSS